MNRIPAFSISRRFLRVWQRNLTVYRKSWKINFLPPFLEPLFYLLAFGIGLSALVGSVRYQGSEISYTRFIAPALIGVSIMYNAFFETTYASFVRMYYQKTFDAMMATPLSLAEVIAGEIIWGATKSFIATAIMMGVISLFGLLHYPEGFFLLPLAFLGGITFGSAGMVFTGMVKNIEMFNLPVFLFVTPMFLFSGTFFPLDHLPLWAQNTALAFPLTHLVNLSRSFGFGQIQLSALWGLGYLFLLSLILFPLAILKMHRRLIK
ncbi:MAG: ABC transporter permease [Deltaproteobacteria bacterium RBG_13_47_9]|nr:MAG: ABC transporter permease [Deltaproteobacteria bacterium RBG_13_47_9]